MTPRSKLAMALTIGALSQPRGADAALTVSFDPDSISYMAGDTLSVGVFVDGPEDIRSFSVSIGFDPGVLTPIAVTPGAALTGGACSHFFVWENDGEASDSVRVDGAALGCSFSGPGEIFRIELVGGEGSSSLACRGLTFRDDANADIAADCSSAGVSGFGSEIGVRAVDVSCISPARCDTVEIFIERTLTTPVRAFSVRFRLSPELVLCDGTNSIQGGSYLASSGNAIFQTVANSDGSFTADGALLGSPCGATDASGTLVMLELGGTADGPAFVSIEALKLRDCANGALPVRVAGSDSILVDATATPVSDVVISRNVSGNDGDGTIGLTVSLTAPGDAAAVHVFRKGTGAYPEYDDSTGTVPSAPADTASAIVEGWERTSVPIGGGVDETPVRDVWYFVAFAEDSCGNVSPPSPVSNGVTNYHLGDVSDGFTLGQGDNLVLIPDISALGASYGIALAPGDSLNFLDVGPTSDGTVAGIPLTDDVIDFEDLVIFALNFGEVSRLEASASPSPGQPVVTLQLDPIDADLHAIKARLVLENHGEGVKASHAVVGYDPPLSLESIERGELLARQRAQVFMGTIREQGRVTVDLAALGAGVTLRGDGVLAELEFTTEGAALPPVLLVSELRDVFNRPIPPGEPVADTTPASLRALGAFPNPFTTSTAIHFELPSRSHVRIRIYDVVGRHVVDLARGVRAAGLHELTWDGRDAGGRPVPSGAYFYVLETRSGSLTRKLLLAR